MYYRRACIARRCRDIVYCNAATSTYYHASQHGITTLSKTVKTIRTLETNKPISLRKGVFALSPLLFFCIFYLISSLLSGDFYATPITIAFMLTCVYAVATTRSISMDKRIELMSKGAGQTNILLMIWIFVMAGAFATTAKEMGAIDATVNLALNYLPGNCILAGIFLASCFVSLSMGTSVGTIAALVPIAQGISTQTNIPVPEMVGLVVGGAFFGDNLSFISDTTIMATRTQGCRMKDKFIVNSKIVIPAALIIMMLYVGLGMNVSIKHEPAPVNVWLVLPYLIVLSTAVAGINVLIVLMLGLFLCLAIGLIGGYADWFTFVASMGKGVMGMSELIIVTLMAGGLMEIVRYNGGIDFIVSRLTARIRNTRVAELSIAALVFTTNLCTANNTIAILTVGPIANEIAESCGVDKRKSASILDTFSCLAQSLIPYGAQLLIASGLAAISPIEIIPYLYYPFLMGAFAILSIIIKKSSTTNK